MLAVTSPGGVVLDTRAVARGWGEVRWVAVRAVDTESHLAGSEVRWVDEVVARRPSTWVQGLRTAWSDLREHRPDLVISAGTGVAAPWFVAARLLAIPTVWIETWNLVGEGHGQAAALCSRLATSVAVQRPERLSAHRRCVLLGELY